jgi:hypothetical protein
VEPAIADGSIETRFKMSSPQIGDENRWGGICLRACIGPRNKLSDRFERKSQNLPQIPDSFSKFPTLAD